MIEKKLHVLIYSLFVTYFYGRHNNDFSLLAAYGYSNMKVAFTSFAFQNGRNNLRRPYLQAYWGLCAGD